jgi:hypothetical protein
MNDFVNPRHRGVNLPAGFKDLMDVLDGKEKAGHEKIREPRFQDLSTNGLGPVNTTCTLRRFSAKWCHEAY